MAFDLSSIKKGQAQRPPRIVLVGEEGVGKSTFCNHAPNPVFICAESGLVGPEFSETKNIAPITWTDVCETLSALTTQKHEHKTLVIDTLDWLEPMLLEKICKDGGKANIEEFGYGKGYTLAAMEWRIFLSKVEFLQVKTGMGVIITAHCQVKTFNNPAGDNYDRYEMKVSKQIAALTKEWADAVLFARFEIYTHKETAKAKAKGVGSTKRIIHTTKHPAWDAKNRFGMPETVPLEWDDVAAAMQSPGDGCESVAAEIREIVESWTNGDKEKALAYLEANKANSTNLKKLLNRVRVKAAA